jgi:hypothetical protein
MYANEHILKFWELFRLDYCFLLFELIIRILPLNKPLEVATECLSIDAATKSKNLYRIAHYLNSYKF